MPKRSELKISKRVVDSLDACAKDTLFWDRDLPGFGVRVHTTGRKTYVVQSRGPEGPKRVTLGRHGEMSADEARRSASEVIDRIKRGEDPTPKPPEAEITVADLAERFIRVHVKTHCKPDTAKSYRSVIENHILPALGGITVTQVGIAKVSALHHSLRDTPTMANTVVHILSIMYTLAENWSLIPSGHNPCRSVHRYRTRPRERFLTPEEFRRLGRALEWAEETMWPPAVAAIRLLLLTGCRRSEILTLRWDDVDRTAGELRLHDAKSGPRMVPLTPPVIRVLDAIPRISGSEWVIPGKRSGSALVDIGYYWQRIRKRAGLEGVRIHDLRHSYASRALALGESLSVIGRLLGHRKITTTARYAHLMRDAEKAAAARVGESIGVHVSRRED